MGYVAAPALIALLAVAGDRLAVVLRDRDLTPKGVPEWC